MALIVLAFLIILNLVSNCHLLRTVNRRNMDGPQTIARRLPPKTNLGPFVDWASFKSPAYSVYVLAIFIAFLGLYTVRLPNTPCH